MAQNKTVTMQDIADRLQVSKALVSLAIADKYGVSEEMRSKIILTAIEMGYQFSNNRQRKNGLLFTIIVNDMAMITELFWSKIVKGIEKTMNTQNFVINILMWKKDVNNKDIIENILNAKPNGVIIINECTNEMLRILEQINLPVVLIDIKHHISMIYDHVYANNYAGGYEAAKHLIEHGHKTIGFVGYKSYSHSFKERYHGFMDYLEIYPENDYEFIKITDAPPEDNPIETFNQAQLIHIMSENNRPTALFCANDPVAFEVYKIVTQLNLRIPEDVSVIGFDNVETCRQMSPPLTSINIPKEEMGKEAVNMLIRRIENPNSVIRHMQLSTEIIDRSSIKPIKKEQ